MRYDLCLVWNWEYDIDFVRLLEAACQTRGLTFLQITPANLGQSLTELDRGQLSFRAYIDRASEADERFLAVEAWAFSHDTLRINPRECSLWAEDKATMHLELTSRGLQTPHTIILPSYTEQPELPALDLQLLGGSFAIKPAHGGGGEGVVLEASGFDQVLSARQQYPDEKYLLQAHVVPQTLGSRPAWFRLLFCTGKTHVCWWDPHSHVYTLVSQVDEKTFGLSPLQSIIKRIATICELSVFSTEVALTRSGEFVVVDYVNDQIDLRLQSRAVDGVPDSIVQDIAGSLAAMVSGWDHQPI